MIREEVKVNFHAIVLWVSVAYTKGDDSYFEVENVTTKHSPADRVLADYFDENLLMIRAAALKELLVRKKENPAT